MAARRPAKIASKKKGKGVAKVHPETGQPMVAARLMRADGGGGMYWVPEDFNGSPESLALCFPVR